MSDTTSPTAAHADLRSESRSYHRDKHHTTKWSLGPRTTLNQPILNSAWNADAPSAGTVKIVPSKWNGRSAAPKTRANVSSKARGLAHHGIEAANLRVARKQDALREVSSPDAQSLSRSLSDLLPSIGTAIPIRRHDAPDAGILYSFDQKASPSDQVGLGGLIEKAEERWRERETVKLVKCEYEVLDGEGEDVRSGRKGRKAKTLAVMPSNVKGEVLEDDEEYEMV